MAYCISIGLKELSHFLYLQESEIKEGPYLLREAPLSHRPVSCACGTVLPLPAVVLGSSLFLALYDFNF